MASSRDYRKKAESLRDSLRRDYENRLSAIFDNSVKVESLPQDLPQRYLMRTLREKGAIAYDPATGLWLPFVKDGVDIYGLPTHYNLIGYNGFTTRRAAAEVIILRANNLRYPVQSYIDIQIDKLVEFDMAIYQNLDAIKTMSVIETPSKAMEQTIKNAAESRRIGASIVYVNEKLQIQNKCEVMSTGAEYLVDKLLQDRSEIWNNTLAYLGVATANTEKRERVQTAEVLASNGYAYDCLNILIDTFNHDAEVGGLSIRLLPNSIIHEQIEASLTELDQGQNNEKEETTE